MLGRQLLLLDTSSSGELWRNLEGQDEPVKAAHRFQITPSGLGPVVSVYPASLKHEDE
jgi:hypothetical protein